MRCFRSHPWVYPPSSCWFEYPVDVRKRYDLRVGTASDLECFDPQRIIAYDWIGANTDITKEAEQATSGKKTIQTALQEALLKRSDYTHIVFDHGTGEIADYISFRSEGSFINVELFHCKAMKGAQYNNSVIDVYEVAQQAIKSTVWIKTKTTLLTKIQSRVKSGNSKKFIRGDIRSLRTLLQSQKAMEVVIYIVQPAISKTSHMNETVGRVLSAAAFYIGHTGRAKELKVLGSP